MAGPNKKKAQAAWDRIESLGGHGVWEPEMVVASLADTGVSDNDLALFRDFPFIQTLDLSRTSVGDKGLEHLANLPQLETLIAVQTKITKAAFIAFRAAHPEVEVVSEPAPKGTVNRFTCRST